MTNFRWAIIGPGPIAHKFADAVTRIDGATLRKIHGRDLQRASAFADQWCRDRAVPGGTHPAVHPCATTDLNAVLHDDDVDAVYIATPHAFHAEAIRACLLAGKPVLCEKPLVLDAATAGELIALARDKNVFLMEAVWTRFLPIYAEVRQWLQANAIGAVRAMQSSFCFNTPFAPASRLFDPTQGGGALLDIGIYNLTITRWVMETALGKCPPAEHIHASAVLGPTSVDHRLTATVQFPEGVTSQFVCGIDTDAENAFHIFGERGHITIHPNFWSASRATLTIGGTAPVTLERPHRINGFEYEIEEAMRCVRAGKIESALVPHAETRQLLAWMDRMRCEVGVRYPFEIMPA
jgi:predicted dehydrogenase